MRIRPLAIGAFVVGGLALLTALLFLIGSRQNAFDKHIKFQTQFLNLSGLVPGAKVRVSGVDAGKISKIDIPHSASEKFRLELEVMQDVHPMIHTDSVVSIETEGVVGDQFLQIKRGTDQAPVAEAGAMLQGKEPVNLAAMMDKANVLLEDVHKTVGDVHGRVDTAIDSITGTVNHADGLITGVTPDIQHIAQNGNQITGKVSALVADLNNGKGPAGLLLRDEETRRQIQATLANVQTTSVNASDASSRADKMVLDFEDRQLAAKAQATLDNVQAISQQLNTTVKDALKQDSMGEDGATNLRETLSNINRSTTNLSEDTEAIKHNFFLRGFFKKRGFFNLDEISSAEYEAACARHKGLGARLWLQSADMFIIAADGKEQLSAAGRSQIDAAVAPVLNNLAGHVIVVEGYAPAATPGQQFTMALRRADQVRRYLEAHYHLRNSDVGIVALGSTPPPGAERASWDGAAVNLLDTKISK